MKLLLQMFEKIQMIMIIMMKKTCPSNKRILQLNKQSQINAEQKLELRLQKGFSSKYSEKNFFQSSAHISF